MVLVFQDDLSRSVVYIPRQLLNMLEIDPKW